MDQTRQGRACELELRRWANLLEALQSEGATNDEAPLIFEDEDEPKISAESIILRSNQTIEKCILAFATHAIEAENFLNQAVNTHFPTILLYEEMESPTQAEVVARMSRFLPALHAFADFLGRVSLMFRNLLQQIRAFYGLSQAELPNSKEWSLTRSWRTLGDLLAILMQTDEIVLHHAWVKRDWNVYRR
ncbi:unnamed protein product, partial [Mesorhabditis spiculigera]